jgi:hypothetical protein
MCRLVRGFSRKPRIAATFCVPTSSLCSGHIRGLHAIEAMLQTVDIVGNNGYNASAALAVDGEWLRWQKFRTSAIRSRQQPNSDVRDQIETAGQPNESHALSKRMRRF